MCRIFQVLKLEERLRFVLYLKEEIIYERFPRLSLDLGDQDLNISPAPQRPALSKRKYAFLRTHLVPTPFRVTANTSKLSLPRSSHEWRPPMFSKAQ